MEPCRFLPIVKRPSFEDYLERIRTRWQRRARSGQESRRKKIVKKPIELTIEKVPSVSSLGCFMFLFLLAVLTSLSDQRRFSLTNRCAGMQCKTSSCRIFLPVSRYSSNRTSICPTQRRLTPFWAAWTRSPSSMDQHHPQRSLVPQAHIPTERFVNNSPERCLVFPRPASSRTRVKGC